MTIDMVAMVAQMVVDTNERVALVLERKRLCDLLTDAGVDIPENYDGHIRWGYSIDIKKEDLPKVRSVVGRLKVTGKDVAPDFATSNELEVNLSPVNGLPVCFEYRTPYRKGGKCEVVDSISQAKITTSLVCKI